MSEDRHVHVDRPRSQPAFTGAERLALAGYRGLTREACTLDLGQFTG